MTFPLAPPLASGDMTWVEFLSATIGQLIWPAFILLVIYLLKDQIKQVAASPRLKRFKAGPGGIEVEFREELDEAKRELEEAKPDAIGPTTPAPSEQEAIAEATSDFYADMQRLAELSPRSVVMETHVRLEQLLREVVSSNYSGTRPPRLMTMRALVREGLKQKLISEAEARVIDDLSVLRNRVAHEPDQSIRADTALEYVTVAQRVAVGLGSTL